MSAIVASMANQYSDGFLGAVSSARLDLAIVEEPRMIVRCGVLEFCLSSTMRTPPLLIRVMPNIQCGLHRVHSQ